MQLLVIKPRFPCMSDSNLSICHALGLVDPFSSDKLPSRRKQNQIPSLVLEEGVVLLLHGCFPKGIPCNLTIGLRVRRMRQIILHRKNRLIGYEYMRRILDLRLSPLGIGWIPNKISYILKSGLCPLGPLH
jgi:hypothetical protein